MPDEDPPDIPIVYWCGQKRYCCTVKWESGAPCKFNHYDLRELYNHMAGPHTATGQPSPHQKPPRTIASPILDSRGRNYEREIPEDLKHLTNLKFKE